MIDRQGTKTIWECDSCDALFESDEGEEFKSAWTRAKMEGWVAKRIGEEWVHGCPRCGA